MIYVIIGIIVLIVFIVLLVLSNYLRLKDLNQNIEVCSSNIDEILKKKKEILDSLVSILDDEKTNKLYEQFDENASMLEKEELLYNINWEANKYMHNKILEHDEKLNDDEIKKLVKELNALEENLEGLREYYNTNVTNYNEKFYKKPFTVVYRILKFDAKKGFKLRKLEEYEILKN